MKTFSRRIQCALFDRGNLLAVAKENDRMSLLRLDIATSDAEEIASFTGSKSLLLTKMQDKYFISVDNQLFGSRDGSEWKAVLRVREGNTISHMCEAPWGLIAQEYGESPTSLHLCSNGSSWKPVLTNTLVDNSSRHFHYVAYDPYRDAALATLGDANLTRAVSLKKDSTWKPLYNGPWQFVPVLPERDRLLFGFDSGIAKGGILIYYQPIGLKQTLFLKWAGKGYSRQCAFAEIISVDDMYVGALATPQALLVSSDARTWYIVYVESLGGYYNHTTGLAVKNDLIAFSSGRGLLLVTKQDLRDAVDVQKKVGMTQYGASLARLRGRAFLMKRMLHPQGQKE